MEQTYSMLAFVIIDGVQSGKEQTMSGSTRIEKLREEVEKLCGNCDRPDKEELGEIILSSMAFGFSVGLEAPSADRPQGEWEFSSTFTDSWGNELAKVKCSHCGYETLAISRIVKDGNFCLNCGTRMKGADDE